MAIKIPLTSWIPRHSPKSEPKFQAVLKEAGEGRLTAPSEIILMRGCLEAEGNNYLRITNLDLQANIFF